MYLVVPHLYPLPAVQEVERGDEDVVEMDMRNSCVLVNETKLKVDLTKYAERHQFHFDEALDEYVTNDQVRGYKGGRVETHCTQLIMWCSSWPHDLSSDAQRIYDC